jgi:hypothetical protein
LRWVESGLKRLGPGLAEGGEWRRDKRLAVDGDFEPWSSGGSDARNVKTVFACQFFDCRNVVGVRSDKQRGGGLGKQAKERMHHERLFLLDDRANGKRECSLCKRHGDAAIGDVARRAEEPAIGEHGEQRVQVGLGVKVDRWRLAPHAAEHRLCVF